MASNYTHLLSNGPGGQKSKVSLTRLKCRYQLGYNLEVPGEDLFLGLFRLQEAYIPWLLAPSSTSKDFNSITVLCLLLSQLL